MENETNSSRPAAHTGRAAAHQTDEALAIPPQADQQCSYPGCHRTRNTHIGTDHAFQLASTVNKETPNSEKEKGGAS